MEGKLRHFFGPTEGYVVGALRYCKTEGMLEVLRKLVSELITQGIYFSIVF